MIYTLIRGYNGFYRISKTGRVQSKRRPSNNGVGATGSWRTLKGSVRKQDGYTEHNLTKNGKGRNKLLHVLVLETFVGPCPPGMECRHLDGNPGNNKLDNLAWGTPEENQADRLLHGTSNQGENHGMSKLNWKKVRRIRRLFASGKLTRPELAQRFCVSPSSISRIISNSIWKETTLCNIP